MVVHLDESWVVHLVEKRVDLLALNLVANLVVYLASHLAALSV